MRRSRLLTAVAVALVLLLVVAAVVVMRGRGPVVEPPLSDGTALVVVAHPDDETYAMALSIDRQVREGRRTVVVLFTDGESSRDALTWAESDDGLDMDHDGDRDEWDFGLARRWEFLDAMRALGVTDTVFLGRAGSQGATGYADAALAEPAVTAEVRRIAEEVGASALFTTMGHRGLDYVRGDARDHPDHGVMQRSAQAVAGEREVPVYLSKVYAYTWPSFLRMSPRRVTSDEAALARKREAVEAYGAIGRSSTPELWEAAHSDAYEYLVTGADL